jgi:hypothetical protein
MFILFQIIIGLLLADILAGIAHWVEDTYIDYCSTFPGLSEIARYNELHHYFPRAMLKHSYFENMKENLIIVFILFILFYLCIPKTMIRYPYLFIPMYLFASTSSLFHRFSHERECEMPSVIFKLQSLGILVSHEHHRQHHISSDIKYCPIFSITNYILDPIYFWRFLEKMISLFGITPSKKSNYNHYKPIQNYMHEDAKSECPKRPTAEDLDELFDNLDNFMKCD